ncbi:MAG TPA: phosphatidylglycerophosphatase A [Candidatus Binatia bacterium]
MPKLQQIILFLVTGAGAGYIRLAPGTAGTVVAIPLSLALNRIAGRSLPLALLTLAAFIAAAVWLCGEGEKIFREKDSQRIVIDEVAGFLLANFAAPAGPKPALLAFLLFRFFDILKPFPARRAEKIPGGLGVALDDLVAGLYTFVIARLIFSWGLL